MFRASKKDKERHRFYLLPGMGGRALKRKHQMVLRWTIAAGLFVSAFVAIMLYFMNRVRPR